MEKQRIKELLLQTFRERGWREPQWEQTGEEDELIFYDFKKSSFYFIKIRNQMNSWEVETEKQRMGDSIKSLASRSDRVYTLYLMLSDGNYPDSTIYPSPDMESIDLSVYWLIDYQNEKLWIPEGQPNSFQRLEKDIRALLSEKEISSYQMENKNKPIYMTMATTILLTAIWLWMEWIGSSKDTGLLLAMGASQPILIRLGEWYRLITSVFLHIGIAHLVMNCVGIFIFGSRLEKQIKWLEWLILFIGSGIAGNILSYFYHLQIQNYTVVGAGASGGVYGLMGALMTITYFTKKRIGGLDAYSILLYFIIGLASSAVNVQVDLMAHLGGFLFGAGIAIPMMQSRKQNIA